MPRRFKLYSSVGAAVSLLALVTAVPALARSNSRAFGSLGTHAAVRINPTNGTSTTFGGWVFTPSGVTSAVSEFKLPALTCSSTLTGVGPGTFMLTGTSTAANFNGAAVLMECNGGVPAAQAQVIVNGVATGAANPLFVGDLMKGTVTTSATTTTATIQDLTAGHTFTFSQSGTGAASLEELLMDDSLVSSTGTPLPVADFGKIPFGGLIGGKTLGSVTPSQAVNMETSANVLQILTSGIEGKKKSAFLTTWKHS